MKYSVMLSSRLIHNAPSMCGKVTYYMNKQHILVFEEDSALAQLYTNVLERTGLVVHRANTFPEMQMLLGTFSISVVDC